MSVGICQRLSRRQRRATPRPFAVYLLSRVLALHPGPGVAVLWTMPRSVYDGLSPLVECWGEERDARLYKGPLPIIAHPPCGPWGYYRGRSLESEEHGIKALELVHRWGGVVEQPLGSQLFRLHGDGRPAVKVFQGDYGHRAPKATLLYFV